VPRFVPPAGASRGISQSWWYTLKRFNNRTHREIIVVVRAEN